MIVGYMIDMNYGLAEFSYSQFYYNYVFDNNMILSLSDILAKYYIFSNYKSSQPFKISTFIASSRVQIFLIKT